MRNTVPRSRCRIRALRGGAGGPPADVDELVAASRSGTGATAAAGDVGQRVEILASAERGEDVRAGAGRLGRRRRVRIQRCPRSRGGSSPSPTPSASSNSSTGSSSPGATSSAFRRRKGARRRPNDDLRGPSSSATRRPSRGRSSCSSSKEAPGAGRISPRGGTPRAPGLRIPEGPADRGPVQGAGRDDEREAGEPARWGVGRARADRGAVRRGGGRPWCGSTRWPRRSETIWAVPGARRSLSRWGRGGEGMTDALVPVVEPPAVDAAAAAEATSGVVPAGSAAISVAAELISAPGGGGRGTPPAGLARWRPFLGHAGRKVAPAELVVRLAHPVSPPASTSRWAVSRSQMVRRSPLGASSATGDVRAARAIHAIITKRPVLITQILHSFWTNPGV